MKFILPWIIKLLADCVRIRWTPGSRLCFICKRHSFHVVILLSAEAGIDGDHREMDRMIAYFVRLWPQANWKIFLLFAMQLTAASLFLECRGGGIKYGIKSWERRLRCTWRIISTEIAFIFLRNKVTIFFIDI